VVGVGHIPRMPAMKGMPRSLAVLAVTFAGTVAITVGLTMIIVQDRATSTADSTPTPFPSIAVGAVPTQTGGSLVVSGDRDAGFRLDRDSYEVAVNPDFERGFARVEYGRFDLIGESGAVHFEHDPLRVAQIDFEAMVFYPDPDECTITPGELNPAIGVASAHLTCPELTDIRDAGTVTIDGGIALPADMLGMRGDLPPPGGRVEVGRRTLEFSDGRVLVQDVTIVDSERQPLFLYGDDETSSIGFERDPERGDLYLTYLVVDEELFELDDDACELSLSELGQLNPITTVLDLSIRCDEVDLGEHGVVTIDTSFVLDMIFQPGALSADS
jgi:hypothetical protein